MQSMTRASSTDDRSRINHVIDMAERAVPQLAHDAFDAM
jgi:hypothetical protein